MTLFLMLLALVGAVAVLAGLRMARNNSDRMYDASAVLADGAAAMTASGYTQAGGADAIFDVGAATRMAADLVIDVSAIDVATGDENYHFQLLGSNDGAGAAWGGTNIMLCTGETSFGDSTTLATSKPVTVADRGVGRYVIPIENVAMVSGVETFMRYLKLRVTHAGAVATSITFTAWIANRQR